MDTELRCISVPFKTTLIKQKYLSRRRLPEETDKIKIKEVVYPKIANK